MLNYSKNIDKILFRTVEKQLLYASFATATDTKKDDFKVLNIRNTKQHFQKRQQRKMDVLPARTNQMKIDQDWGSVWPGPRTFHPATVPLPVRQGYTENNVSPGKFANAELMKIPNFLHLTPPVIKRQCEALKRFCTTWPNELDSVEKCDKLFPLEIIASDYCHSSPSIRNPLARIVTVRFKLEALKLNQRARDKYLRLVGDRYNEENDTVTIVTDRCPLKKQNYDYAMYLVTALFHESWNVEPWEDLKSEADMEYYEWKNNISKTSIETIFSKAYDQINGIEEYSKAVSDYMNEGENDYTVTKYSEAVRNILNLPNNTS